jgi:hypothetical protein
MLAQRARGTNRIFITAGGARCMRAMGGNRTTLRNTHGIAWKEAVGASLEGASYLNLGIRAEIRLAAPVLTLWLCCAGCGVIMMVGEPVKERDFTSQDNAEENLKAIRAMLADQRSRHAPTAVKPSDGSSVPVPPSTESKSEVEPHSTLNPVTPSSASSSVNADAPAKLPWTPPSVSRSSPPDRSVPAYTIPAPVGPDYSGPIRCVPDGMGGQRCMAR